MSLRGFYPSARAVFVPCTPVEACVGGANSTVLAAPGKEGCGVRYTGLRCAQCRVGAYRLKAACAPCPNTAWLLFLGFSLAIVAAVGAAVYLSKKRINMAGLSIGVVSVCVCCVWWCVPGVRVRVCARVQ